MFPNLPELELRYVAKGEDCSICACRLNPYSNTPNNGDFLGIIEAKESSKFKCQVTLTLFLLF
jgi:hypothetical protein